MRIVFGSWLLKEMTPSVPLRIELILAAVPQAVQPGIFTSKVFSAAVTGTAIKKNIAKAAIRLRPFFPTILPISCPLDIG